MARHRLIHDVEKRIRRRRAHEHAATRYQHAAHFTKRGRLVGDELHPELTEHDVEGVGRQWDRFGARLVPSDVRTRCRCHRPRDRKHAWIDVEPRDAASRADALSGSNPDAISGAILKGSPLLGDVRPATLVPIISKALQADRTRRYQRASDMHADLQRLQQSAVVRAHNGRRGLALAAALFVAVAVAAFGYFVTHARSSPGAAAPARRSVAVLPFKPLAGGTSEDDYLGLGLSEALITELGAFRTIAVRPLSASRRYGADRDAVSAGRELGAELVVDGAIQRSADRLRVNVALVRVADGLTVWTD